MCQSQFPNSSNPLPFSSLVSIPLFSTSVSLFLLRITFLLTFIAAMVGLLKGYHDHWVITWFTSWSSNQSFNLVIIIHAPPGPRPSGWGRRSLTGDLSADSSSRGLSSPCSAFEIGRQFYFPVWTDGCWLGDFPGSPVVKTWPSSVGAGCGFNPWSGSWGPTCLRAKNPKQKTEAIL